MLPCGHPLCVELTLRLTSSSPFRQLGSWELQVPMKCRTHFPRDLEIPFSWMDTVTSRRSEMKDDTRERRALRREEESDLLILRDQIETCTAKVLLHPADAEPPAIRTVMRDHSAGQGCAEARRAARCREPRDRGCPRFAPRSAQVCIRSPSRYCGRDQRACGAPAPLLLINIQLPCSLGDWIDELKTCLKDVSC